MKNENYYTIQGWMVNDLKLKGSELLVYALVYGFSQDDVSRFRGSLNYISESVGISKRTVQSILDKMYEKELLTKETRIGYPSEWGVANIACPPRKYCMGTHADSATYINNNNNKDIKAKTFKSWTLDDFTKSVKDNRDKFPNLSSSDLMDFENHWTEKTASKKMKFQAQSSWETLNRLRTWANNKKKWDS